MNELKWSKVEKGRAKRKWRKRPRPKQPLSTANRFASLSSCKDDSTELHDDVTVKTSNCLSDRTAGSERRAGEDIPVLGCPMRTAAERREQKRQPPAPSLRSEEEC